MSCCLSLSPRVQLAKTESKVDIRMCTSVLYLPERMCYKLDVPTIPGRDGHMAHAWKRGWHLATGSSYNRSNCKQKLRTHSAYAFTEIKGSRRQTKNPIA
jgi:hypothetical protein